VEGRSVYRDVQTHVGKRWHKEIEKELHATKAVVVLWSVRSRDSDFVLEEAEYGKLKEILFPAFIERVDFPYGFGRIQTADLIGWVGDEGHPGLAQLLESLRQHLNNQAHSLGEDDFLYLREATPGSGDVLHADGVVTSNPVQPAPAQVPTPQTFRDRLKTGADGPLMVVIPAGRFRMGSPEDEPERSNDEGPPHGVRIGAPFAMGVYAVTFEDYERFCVDTKLGKPDDQGPGPGPEAGHQRLLGGRARLLCLAWRAVRAQLPAPQRGGVGIRLPGWHGCAVPFRPTYHHGPGQLRW
jgi:hypothetical protein